MKQNEEINCDEEVVFQGKYQHFTDNKERIELGKQTSKYGITLTICYFVAVIMHTIIISPFFINKWQGIDIFLERQPTVPVPVLTTTTTYNSWTFPVSHIAAFQLFA